MTVRAKFKVSSIARTMGSAPVVDPADGKTKYVPAEMQTIKLFPVYGNGDPAHENTKFWQASPSGTIELSTVNAAAGNYFELDKEYYIDFTKAA